VSHQGQDGVLSHAGPDIYRSD